MNKLLKSFVCLISFFYINSCGLPDVTSITQELNQPFIIRLIPGSNKVVVEFQAQNNEPAFSGYNIYFGDSVNPQQYRLYNSQKARPTIITSSSQTLNTYTFTIESQVYYSEGSGEIETLTESELQNGIPIYVWVSSYQITPQSESYYYYDNYVKMATPRPEQLNYTATIGNDSTNISSSSIQTIATLHTNSSGELIFQNVSGGSMQRVAGTSLDDVNVPPEDGYQSVDLKVIAGRLYLTKKTSGTNSNYGKIYVRSVSQNSADIDFCYQTSADIFSY